MADQFVGEIRMFAGNFAPTGWAFCEGQLIAISQNTALFSLLGTTYGGDGKTTFALPNLSGRMPMHAGNGPGLTPRALGEAPGSDTVALVREQMPTHKHAAQSAVAPDSTQPVPGASFLARTANDAPAYHAADNHVKMTTSTLLSNGAGAPHDNLQPYLAVSFIIALQGIFPPRS